MKRTPDVNRNGASPATKEDASKARAAVLADVRGSAAARISPGPDAARSQDFLYDEDGLPG